MSYTSNRVTRLLSAAGSGDATLCKSGIGFLNRVVGYNANAAARYIKFYDAAVAPVMGAGTPVMTVYLPATTAFSIQINLQFAAGLGFTLTTGFADNDVGGVTAGDILGLNVITA